MTRSAVARILLVLSILLAVLGLATLVPHESRMISDLGYDTFCPFAPWSTLTLLLLAALGWIVRRHILSQPVEPRPDGR
jgi:Mn2+/Fe2+ NRAMP family transporter